MRVVEIFDTTLRDGEQSPGVNLNEAEKVEIALQLEKLGVNVLEAGFPASSKSEYAAVEKVAGQIKFCTVAGMARSNQKDIDLAWGALQKAVSPRLHLFVPTSPIHMKYKLGMKPDQVVETAVSAVQYAAQFFSDIEWSAEDASRSELPFLVHIVEKVIEAGATVINLPDTVGYALPHEYAHLIRYVREHVPNIHRVKLSAHCHDDLGLAVANSLAAIESGVDQVECTMNGIGERAGNASLEEIGVGLAVRRDALQIETNLNLQEIVYTSQLVSQLTGMVVQPNKAIIGDNAFAHESGIHQDGLLKNRQTYEIIQPEMIGLKSNTLVLGKHSGRHAFQVKCTELGFHLDKCELNECFIRFKELTESKKEVTDEDILHLLQAPIS